MADTQKFLEVALEAVKKAEPIFIKHYGRASGIVEKIDDTKYKSPVTDADKEIEQLLTASLLSKFPDHSVCGEEFPETKNGSQYVWYLDPIDGTINYIRGLPFCAISVALWKEGGPLVGVVSDPVNGVIYSALRGKGAFRGASKLAVSAVGVLAEGMGNVGRTKTRPDNPALERVARKIYRGREFGGGALELCALAEGKLDFYISERTKIIDAAAGMLVVTEAGGTVTDWSGGPYLPESKNIVASNGKIHEELLKELKG